ncbi:hypothetical protein WA026_003239 [Henosepilachna vigintioctopunctata]|uniref:AD domain-containing protein n=1 Tax=Henosepilachna vigintioctopunctata TaxID=420089 RepID=A0AAW1TIP3_9CUCU
MDDDFECIKDDVFFQKSLIGKRVKIKTADNVFFEGIVYVIDPVYKTVILCDNEKIRLFVYLSIECLEVLSEEVIEPSFLLEPKQNDIGDWKNIKERRERLCKWLKHMLINVKEEGEVLKVEEYLIIGPPYTQETCYCDNTIILERIRNILNMMPDEFQ